LSHFTFFTLLHPVLNSSFSRSYQALQLDPFDVKAKFSRYHEGQYELELVLKLNLNAIPQGN